jgi:acetylornithine/succinyldiaminopimelate/putrescine aminotransferase
MRREPDDSCHDGPIGRKTDARSCRPPDLQGENYGKRALVNCGYILAQRPGLNVLRLDPGLTIERRDIEGFLETFEVVLTNGK